MSMTRRRRLSGRYPHRAPNTFLPVRSLPVPACPAACCRPFSKLTVAALLAAAGAMLNTDYLTKRPFTPDPGYQGSRVIFQRNGTFSYLSIGNCGGFLWKGLFSITGNAVTLAPSECSVDGKPMNCNDGYIAI